MPHDSTAPRSMDQLTTWGQIIPVQQHQQKCSSTKGLAALHTSFPPLHAANNAQCMKTGRLHHHVVTRPHEPCWLLNGVSRVGGPDHVIKINSNRPNRQTASVISMSHSLSTWPTCSHVIHLEVKVPCVLQCRHAKGGPGVEATAVVSPLEEPLESAEGERHHASVGQHLDLADGSCLTVLQRQKAEARC